MSSVRLFEQRGETSIFVDAEVDEAGRLVISGLDIGDLPRRIWGDSDYEYWLTVEAAAKPAVLRALTGAEGDDVRLLQAIERRFGGQPDCFRQLSDFFDEHKIAYTFQSWV